MHHSHLAMHDLVATDDLAAEGLADGLMAKANAQKRRAGLGAGSQGPGERRIISGRIPIAS
jgi:hypothetical protein